MVKNRYHILMVIGQLIVRGQWSGSFRTTFHVIESKLRRRDVPILLYRDLSG